MDLTLSPAAHSAIARRAANSTEPGDVAVEHGGARISCSPAAGRRVYGGHLDIRRDDRGRLRL